MSFRSLPRIVASLQGRVWTNLPALVALAFALSPNAHAQNAADGYAPSIVGRIDVIVALDDGKALVGGEMNDANCRRLCRLLADGRVDSTFSAPAIDKIVYSIAVQPDGKVLIGGSFSTVGTATRQRIARLTANGNLDESFVGPALNNTSSVVVKALSVQPDGKVMMGGIFDTVGGQARKGVARLNANGSLDTNFVDPQLNGGISAFVRQADGKLLLAGSFNSVGGHAGSVARLHASGRLDTAFVAPVFGGGIHQLAVQADGKLMVGGLFSTVGGQARNNLARLNANGSVDASYADPAVNSSVGALIVQPDGRVLIGGLFTMVAARRANT